MFSFLCWHLERCRHNSDKTQLCHRRQNFITSLSPLSMGRNWGPGYYYFPVIQRIALILYITLLLVYKEAQRQYPATRQFSTMGTVYSHPTRDLVLIFETSYLSFTCGFTTGASHNSRYGATGGRIARAVRRFSRDEPPRRRYADQICNN